MRPLMKEPATGIHVLCVFYDFGTKQYIKHSDEASVHISNLVCLQQFSLKCEKVQDIEYYVQGGKRKHSFLEDPVGDMFSYLCESYQWANEIIVISHKTNAFDLHLI